jgi:hypothetical protein
LAHETVTPPEWSLLGALYEAPKGIRLRELASELGVEASFVTPMAKSLEAKQFVQVLTDEDDSRAKIIFITATGKEFIKKNGINFLIINVLFLLNTIMLNFFFLTIKFIFLTGTPMYNDPKEIIYLLNLMNLNETSWVQAFDACKQLAANYGVEVSGSELVGMVPESVILATGNHFLGIENTHFTKNDLVSAAVAGLGLSDKVPFVPEEKIIEWRYNTLAI